ncbi:MAG: rRNA maturation RNase YbeY [Egibacteraceae bacterium]
MAVFLTDEQDEPVDLERLRRLAGFVMRDQGVAMMELSVGCVDRDTMAALHAEHLDGDGPTDVLAFPLDAPGDAPSDAPGRGSHGEPGLLGDVVLCPAVASAQAPEHDRSPEAELDLLCVHGVLHLLGHDHHEPEERRVMFGLTDRLLADFAARASHA